MASDTRKSCLLLTHLNHFQRVRRRREGRLNSMSWWLLPSAGDLISQGIPYSTGLRENATPAWKRENRGLGTADFHKHCKRIIISDDLAKSILLHQLLLYSIILFPILIFSVTALYYSYLSLLQAASFLQL